MSDPRGAVPPEIEGWDVENDALAHAISWLSRHHGQERSPESLLAGMPLDGRLGPDQALRALRDAGYTAGLVQRRVAELHQLLLPAVLLLKEGDACIVVARRGDGADGAYDIVMPGRQHHACSATEAELDAEYTGLALVATPLPAQEGGSTEPLLLHDPGSHWMWGTIDRKSVV